MSAKPFKRVRFDLDNSEDAFLLTKIAKELNLHLGHDRLFDWIYMSPLPILVRVENQIDIRAPAWAYNFGDGVLKLQDLENDLGEVFTFELSDPEFFCDLKTFMFKDWPHEEKTEAEDFIL